MKSQCLDCGDQWFYTLFFSPKPWFYLNTNMSPVNPLNAMKFSKLIIKFISDKNRTLCQSACLKVQGRKSLDQSNKGSLLRISDGRCVMEKSPLWSWTGRWQPAHRRPRRQQKLQVQLDVGLEAGLYCPKVEPPLISIMTTTALQTSRG